MSQVFQQAQIGEESQWGTGANATAKLMGVEDVTIEPNVTTILHGERRGSLAPGFVTNISQVSGSATLEVLASYEDLPYLLDGLFSEATAGSAPGYERTYAAPLLSPPAPKPQSITAGQTGGVYRLEGALATQLTLTGEHSQPLKASARFEGVRAVSAALASLADRSVNFLMGHQAKLFIDAWNGAAGTTEVTATAWAFQLTVNANRMFNRSLGSLTPISWHDGDAENRWGGELRLSLELTPAVAAYLNTILAASPAVLERQVRIQYELDTGHVFTIDFAGAALAAPALFSDMEGMVSVDLTLTGKYNTAMGNWLEMSVINSIQTMP